MVQGCAGLCVGGHSMNLQVSPFPWPPLCVPVCACVSAVVVCCSCVTPLLATGHFADRQSESQQAPVAITQPASADHALLPVPPSPPAVAQVSQAACEDVVGYCIDKKDYWAAAEAWVYTRVYCADPSRRQPSEAAADAAGQAADSQQQQQPQREGPLGWAGSRLVRTYAVGLAAWLQQGCVSTGHEHYVRQQLQQLVGELEGRGLSVPAKVKAALANDAAPAAAAAPEAPAAAAATSEPEAEAAAGPAAAAESEGSKETAT